MVERIKRTRPYRAVRDAKARLERARFERGDLIDTGEEVSLKEFGLDDPERIDYEASSWSFLRRALRRCKIGPDDVFLDIGSGKGRVVWQAAQLPFARVIGIEIAPELNAVARGNIERNRDRLEAEVIELVTADATSFEIPDYVTFIYLYNPVKGVALRKILNNIAASLDREPRELTLIYANPEQDEDVLATGKFERKHVLKGLRPDVDSTSWVNVYTSLKPARDG